MVRSRSVRFVANAFVGVLAAISLTTPSSAGECTLLEGGDFVDGLAGWSIEIVEQSADGDAGANAAAFFFDGSTYGDPPLFDAHTLAISAHGVSGLNQLPGAAAVEIVASTTATVGDRYLRMKRGGGFEFQFWGATGRELRVWLEAVTADGRVARRIIYHSLAEPGDACEPGLSVLGTFDAPENRVQLDLGAAGILPGELVTVSIGVRVAVETNAPCQFLVNEAYLIVDRLEFCNTRLFRGDLNCDGTLDFFDIDPFIHALFDPAGYAATWPNCDILNADLNDDQRVDFFDIDGFVACLFGTCP